MSGMAAQVLEELDVGHIPMISVWNKVDVCADPEMVQAVAQKRENTVCISAQTGQGLPELMNLVEHKVQQSMMPVNVLVPYAQVTAQPLAAHLPCCLTCTTRAFFVYIGCGDWVWAPCSLSCMPGF